MKVVIHVNVTDMTTKRIAALLRPVFTDLVARLEGEYGGSMDHLWISFELVECWSRPDGKARYPFRFQKRVSGRSRLGLPPVPDSYNVGHFSVRPDFKHLLALPDEQVVQYSLSLIYRGSAVLLGKEKKLGGFNASQFRERLLYLCNSGGRCIEA